MKFTESQLEITRLLWNKELSFWCYIKYTFEEWVYELYRYIGEFKDIDGKEKHHFLWEDNVKYILDLSEIGKYIEVIGHLATDVDLKVWLNSKGIRWEQWENSIQVNIVYDEYFWETTSSETVDYDSNKSLIAQPEYNLTQVIALIKSK